MFAAGKPVVIAEFGTASCQGGDPRVPPFQGLFRDQ